MDLFWDRLNILSLATCYREAEITLYFWLKLEWMDLPKISVKNKLHFYHSSIKQCRSNGCFLFFFSWFHSTWSTKHQSHCEENILKGIRIEVGVNLSSSSQLEKFLQKVVAVCLGWFRECNKLTADLVFSATKKQNRCINSSGPSYFLFINTESKWLSAAVDPRIQI